MSQTTKLIRHRIQAKREQKALRANRLKLWLSVTILLAVLLFVPLGLLLGSAGFLVWGQLQEIPTYSTLISTYQAQNPIAPPEYFGRTSSGETVPLNLNQQGVYAQTWLPPEEISPFALNGVYAQWPDHFLTTTQEELTLLARSQTILTADANSQNNPAASVARFVRSDGAPSGALEQIEHNLLQNQIQSEWSAEELAAWYLNSGDYGNQILGLEGAARFYLNRAANELTLPEAAMLVSILRNPAVNPLDDSAGAKLAQEAVLEEMLRQDLISQEQFVAARFTPLEGNLAQFGTDEGTNVMLQRLLQHELDAPFTTNQVTSGDFNIITTLDVNLQTETDCLARFYGSFVSGQGLNGDGACATGSLLTRSAKFPNGPFNSADSMLIMVIDPNSGQILALSGYGAITQNPSGLPNKPAGLRQTGPLFYPLVYLTALSQGHNLSSMVVDVTNPESENPTGEGPIFLAEALESKAPTAAADVLDWVGQGTVFRIANELGAEPVTESGRYTPSQNDVSAGILDLAAAYSVLANQGVRVGIEPFGQTQQPYLIAQVENGRGDILYEASDALGAEQPILPSEVVWLLNQQLAQESLPNGQFVAQVSGSGLNNQDEWTIGYTPNLLVAVWAGNQQGEGVRNTGEQAVTPALWETVMTFATAERPVTNWPAPDNIVALNVCWPSGLQPNGLCPTREGLFVAGTEPVQFDTMYQSFLVNRENGNLATSSTPTSLITEEIYQIFPAEARKWAELRGFPTPPDTYDSISIETVADRFEVTSPDPFEAVLGSFSVELTLDETGEFDQFRVAAYQGLSPGKLEVLADGITPRRNRRSVVIPINLPEDESGLITLLITGFRPDGTIDELAIPITVE